MSNHSSTFHTLKAKIQSVESMGMLKKKKMITKNLSDLSDHLNRPHEPLLKSTPSLWSVQDQTVLLKRLSTQSIHSLASSVTTTTSSCGSSKSTRRRFFVLQELLMTEKSYLSDMQLVQEIYMDDTVFTRFELKQIFINLPDMIQLSHQLIQLLEDSDMAVGFSYNSMMKQIEQTYAEFCKKHQDAIHKIQDLTKTQTTIHAFLKQCNQTIQGQTTCWDLESLLIKPVQRVLKYPLLLKEIVQLTPKHHSDYNQLVVALHDIQQVADNINEIKRRKDLAEQLIHNKDRSNKLSRRKKISHTQDTQFDNLYQQFEARQEMARELEYSVQKWILDTRNSIQSLSRLVQDLEAVYGDSDGIGLRSMKAFRKLVSRLESYPLETHVQEKVYRQIESYLKLFKNPYHVIQKRNQALSDYDRTFHSKRTTADHKQVSFQVYTSLNATLVDELPQFLHLSSTYFQTVLDAFTQVQALFWQYQRTEWKMLTIELPFGERYSWQSIESDYQKSLVRVQKYINDIIILRMFEDQQRYDSGYEPFNKSSSMH
ncbi:hypothetical protein CU098_005223, partial [Rhizopus stolonifer]